MPIFLSTDNLVQYTGLSTPGAGRMTSSSTTLTCSTSHSLTTGDYIWINGQERKVTVTNSTTITIATALQSEVVDARWRKSIDNATMVARVKDENETLVTGSQVTMAADGVHGDYSGVIPDTISLTADDVYDVEIVVSSPADLVDRERVRAKFKATNQAE